VLAVSCKEIFDAIRYLEIISIELEQNDNAQIIFESINSTGLGLSTTDKIRNLVLMDLQPDVQKKFYEKYWKEITRLTTVKKRTPDDFFSSFLAFEKHVSVNKEDSYDEIKELLVKSNNVEPFLKRLVRFAGFFKRIANGDDEDRRVKQALADVALLNRDVLFPFFFALLEHREQGKLSATQVEKIIRITESFVFRIAVCGLQTGFARKFFAALDSRILKVIGDKFVRYDDVFAGILLSNRSGSARFPDNKEFSDSIGKQCFFKKASLPPVYYFSRLENDGSKEGRKDIAEGFAEKRFSVEHIMPQKLSSSWKKNLGEKFKEIHEKWLNRIANLTLTGLNSELGNKPFEEKKKIIKENGRFFLNEWILQQEKWTEEELSERQEKLQKKFLELWPFPPPSNYTPTNEEDEGE